MSMFRSSKGHDDLYGTSPSRRRFLGFCAAGAAGLMVRPASAAVKLQGERSLKLHNLHTGESLKQVYWAEGEYIEEGLADINKLLRDHRTGDIHPIDPALLDMLHKLHGKVGARKAFHIISGYRSPRSNNLLRNSSNGVAKKSLHMQGKAIDIRLPGHDLKHLQKAARSLKAGGVGYYAKSDFIHVDTGRVRFW